jgi:hypothetical protein
MCELGLLRSTAVLQLAVEHLPISASVSLDNFTGT